MSPTEGAAMDNPAAIELAGLTKRYRRGKDLLEAVRDVTLSVPAGQVIGLLGPNGAGKTTIIKMICGLILPSAGTIRLNRYDVARQRAAAVRQIGAVLEGSRNVYWPLSAWQNLLYFGRLKGLRGAQITPRAERLLTELGLWERRHETVGSYSRGMQQKVAVAAALITDPPILLTTHQLPIAQELAGRIAVIRDGQIIADLPTPELLSRYAEDRFEVRTARLQDGFQGVLPPGTRIEPEQGATRILLPDTDQAGLHKVLDGLRASGVPLLSVSQAQPGLEEVFLWLIRPGDSDGRAAATAAAGSRGGRVA